MKSIFLLFAITTCVLVPGKFQYLKAQTASDTTQTYLIIKNDGSRYVGKILSQDAREVRIFTEKLGEIIIPKHEIQEIRAVQKDELTSEGRIKDTGAFATRYYITTNALALSKGDNYIIWNIYGPDIQFGLSDKFGVGFMTSWFGTPVIGSAKYSIVNKKNVGIAVGTLLGTGSWTDPGFGLALPFGSLTFGNKEKNLTFSMGYGAVWESGNVNGSALYSLAAMNRLSDRVSLVFDSFIFTPENFSTTAIIIPALRLHSSPEKAFQIGFAGIAADGSIVPFPLPFLQWYRKF